MLTQRTTQRTSVPLNFTWAPGVWRLSGVASALRPEEDAEGRAAGPLMGAGHEFVFERGDHRPHVWEGAGYVTDTLANLIEAQHRGQTFHVERFCQRAIQAALPPLTRPSASATAHTELVGLWLRAATLASMTLHLARHDPLPDREALNAVLGSGPYRLDGRQEYPWAASAPWYGQWARAEFGRLPVRVVSEGLDRGMTPVEFRLELAAYLRRQFTREHRSRLRVDLGTPVIETGLLTWARFELAYRVSNAPASMLDCPECGTRFTQKRPTHKFCRPTCRRSYRRRGGPRGSTL